jgi:hypothetical protein
MSILAFVTDQLAVRKLLARPRLDPLHPAG